MQIETVKKTEEHVEITLDNGAVIRIDTLGSQDTLYLSCYNRKMKVQARFEDSDKIQADNLVINTF